MFIVLLMKSKTKLMELIAYAKLIAITNKLSNSYTIYHKDLHKKVSNIIIKSNYQSLELFVKLQKENCNISHLRID